MFREYVAIPEAPNRSLFTKPKVQRFNMAEIKSPKVTEKTVQEYQTISDTGSRFEWAFDLCSVTLANFNYRKMSLVRDYDAVLAGESDPETLFERFFTDKPLKILLRFFRTFKSTTPSISTASVLSLSEYVNTCK